LRDLAQTPPPTKVFVPLGPRPPPIVTVLPLALLSSPQPNNIVAAVLPKGIPLNGFFPL